jgi:hypothetical protein
MGNALFYVMTGLDPVIHAAPQRMLWNRCGAPDVVGGRVKPGHDKLPASQ